MRRVGRLPVMVARRGDRLLREDAIVALRDRLLPLAAVVTPNAPEATVLAGFDVEDQRTAHEAARRIHAFGPRLVIVKGGHLGGEPSEDIAFDGTPFEVLSAPRIDTPHTHGTGCTFSAAIVAGLALGQSPLDAAQAANAFLYGVIERAEPLGAGHGPVNHPWRDRDV